MFRIFVNTETIYPGGSVRTSARKEKHFIYDECASHLLPIVFQQSFQLQQGALWVAHAGIRIYLFFLPLHNVKSFARNIKNSPQHKEVISSLGSCRVALPFQNNAFFNYKDKDHLEEKK